MNGWIQLHRQLLEWEWYDDANPCRLFLHCLLKANWRAKQWRGINIPRGSFFTSSEHLASDLKLSRQQIRSALNKLKSTGDITTNSTNYGLLVTVCKFDAYNSEEPFDQPPFQPPNEPSDNQQVTDEQPTDNQRVTTTEKGNKDNKGTKKVWAPDPIQKRINSWFRRRNTTEWSDKEKRSYQKITFTDEDLDLMAAYYTATIPEREDYRRRDPFTLLNNWPSELDRARRHQGDNPDPQQPLAF